MTGSSFFVLEAINTALNSQKPSNLIIVFIGRIERCEEICLSTTWKINYIDEIRDSKRKKRIYIYMVY